MSVNVNSNGATVKIVTADIVTVTGETVGGGGGGFVYIADAEPISGTITDKVFQDAGNNVLQSFTSSQATVNLRIRASYPIVRIDGVDTALTLDGNTFEGLVQATIPTGSGAQDVTVQVRDPNGDLQASDTVSATVNAPAELLTLAFSGGYPGAQTQLKAGDTFQLVGTANQPIDAIQLNDSGAGNGALITFAATTSFSVPVTIPDRGGLPSTADLIAAPRDATSGALGATLSTNASGAGVDGVNTVQLSNLAPTAVFGAITYPATQGALKGSESADLVFTFSNASTVVFSSPTAELSITDPTTLETTKTVTRIAGDTNESTPNIQAVVTRAANGAEITVNSTVLIQNVAPTISLSLPQARLRSGGNNGTAAQNYTLSLVSDQQLAAAPSLATDSGGNRGTFTTAFSGGPSTWTRTLQVSETVPDEKGTFTFEGLSATNLAGLSQNTIGSGASYTLGGFVARTLTFGPFATTTNIGTEVNDFSKLQAGVFSATGGAALRQSIGTSPPVVNGYTIAAVDVNPTSLIWLDTAAASTNSGGTATISNVEETV